MAKLPMDDAGAAAPLDDAAGAGAPMDEGDDAGHEVLLTVCREGDGTYRLIQGDEEEAAPGGEADDQGMGATDEGEGKIYDSKGALLKAILDILNEDEGSAGADGSSEDQFQAGFSGDTAAPPAPAGAASMAQKF